VIAKDEQEITISSHEVMHQAGKYLKDNQSFAFDLMCKSVTSEKRMSHCLPEFASDYFVV
jgi:hypothetical protein